MANLDDPKRLAAFRAYMLGIDDDPVLQDCVGRAARQADAPIALISFVMKKVLFFRAAIGLPPELETTRAVSRRDLFCQFVVMAEQPFIVTDARRDPRVPQAMIDTYGVAAYLGVPIRAEGHVLGSLCVADSSPRNWRPELVSELGTLADRVSARLEELASFDPSADLTIAAPIGLAARTAVLTQVVMRSLVEVGPMVRLAQGAMRGISPETLLRAGSMLTQASQSYDEIIDLVAELCIATKRLEHSVAKMAVNT